MYLQGRHAAQANEWPNNESQDSYTSHIITTGTADKYIYDLIQGLGEESKRGSIVSARKHTGAVNNTLGDTYRIAFTPRQYRSHMERNLGCCARGQCMG